MQECLKACEDSFKCKAFTRGVGSSSACRLWKAVDLAQCTEDSKYETHVLRVDPDYVEAKCVNYAELKCGESVAWNFHAGSKESWAAKAYENMRNVSGLKYNKATIDDFHRLQYCGGLKKGKCELPPCGCSNPPCDTCGSFVPPPAPPLKGPSEHNLLVKRGRPMGYSMQQDKWVGQNWCKAQPPKASWNVNKGCSDEKSVKVKVLLYNLFWWHLFDVRDGGKRQAGRLIEETGPYDFMGFQECDNVTRIVDDALALSTHEMYNGTAAVSNAWSKSTWKTLETGFNMVSEDHESQWHGKRAVVWTRAQHKKTKKVVFFMNYHGSLPVGGSYDGGKCGGEATAYNMLRVIGEHASHGDSVILVGDFNNIKNSELLRTLGKYLKHDYQGESFKGVDNVFSNSCAKSIKKENLGNGGSDHDALAVTFRI